MSQPPPEDRTPGGMSSRETLRRAMAALGEKHRFLLVLRLKDRPGTVTELVGEFRWPQPLLSHHLSILCRAGLVDVERMGRRRIYRLSRPEDPALQVLLDLVEPPGRDAAASGPVAVTPAYGFRSGRAGGGAGIGSDRSLDLDREAVQGSEPENRKRPSPEDLDDFLL